MVEINLLPKQYRKTGETSAWQYASLGLGLLTLLLIGIPELIIGGIINGKQHELDDKNSQIGSLNQTVIPEYNQLTQQKSQLGLVDQTVQALTATKTRYWSTDLANFVNATPSNTVHINRLAITEPAITTTPTAATNALTNKTVLRTFDVDGEADSATSVVNFLNTYDQNDYGVTFKSAQHVDAQPSSDQNPGAPEKYTFSATVQQYQPSNTTGATPTAPGATPTATDSAPEAPGAAPAAPAAPAASTTSGGKP